MLQLLIDFETQLGEFFQHLYISMGCYTRWKRLASEESGHMIWCYDNGKIREETGIGGSKGRVKQREQRIKLACGTGTG